MANQSSHNAPIRGKLGGYFTLDCAGLGPSRPIGYDAMPSAVQAYINMDMPDLGGVRVTRSSDTFCACEGAYTWSITFLHLPAPSVIKTTIKVVFDLAAFPTTDPSDGVSPMPHTQWRSTRLTDDLIKEGLVKAVRIKATTTNTPLARYMVIAPCASDSGCALTNADLSPPEATLTVLADPATALTLRRVLDRYADLPLLCMQQIGGGVGSVFASPSPHVSALSFVSAEEMPQAAQWRIPKRGDKLPAMTAASYLTGEGAAVTSTASVMIDTSVVSGRFSLSAGHTDGRSVELPFNATTTDVHRALWQELDMPIHTVTRDNGDQQVC
jgi:hypothetical protein